VTKRRVDRHVSAASAITGERVLSEREKETMGVSFSINQAINLVSPSFLLLHCEADLLSFFFV
jgi:hypothetical protein